MTMRAVVGRFMRGLRSRLLRASGLILTVNALDGAMNLVATILTIRHLPLEVFGILTVVLSTMQVIAGVSTGGLNETLLTMVSRAEAARQPHEVSRSLAINLHMRLIVMAVTVTGGLLLVRPIATGLFRQPDLAFVFFLALLGACGANLWQFSLMALQAARAYYCYAAVKLVRFTALLVALVVLAGLGQLDLTTAVAVNAGAPLLAFAVSLSFKSVRTLRGGGNSLALLRQVWDLSKWVWLGNLCAMVYRWLQIYLVTVFTSLAELGIYSAAFKLCGEIHILQNAVRTVLFPEVSRRAGSVELASFTRRCLGPLVLLSALLVGLGLLVSPLIPVLLGERYVASMGVFLILLAARSALIPLVPLGLLFFATDRTPAVALFGIMQIVVLGAVGPVLIPSYGALGAAWTQVVVIAVATVYLVIFAWPYLWSSRIPVGGRVPSVE
jgi:O-antigen/teichoic acid export membrane protein